MSREFEIRTPRLTLLGATAPRIRWEAASHAELSASLDAEIPADWPPVEVRDALDFFAEAMAKKSPDDPWRIFYWLAQTAASSRLLIGSGGFMGVPNADGAVEVGYGVLAEFQGRGYATEAIGGMTNWALAQPDVRQIWADALPENVASVRVLQKNGFAEVGPGAEDGTRRYEKNGEVQNWIRVEA